MRVGVSRVAKPAIGERQRIVKARGMRLDRERGREIPDGGGVVAARECGTTGAIERGRIARRKRQRFGKGRLRRVGTSLDEPYVSEPYERGHVVRIDPERGLEHYSRFVGLVAAPIDLCGEIRPSQIVRRQD